MVRSLQQRIVYSVHNHHRLSKRTAQVTKEEVQAVVESANEETLSTRSLVAKQESNVIITSPREYQLELFQKAKQQNIIAVLDTGQEIQQHSSVFRLIQCRFWQDFDSSPTAEAHNRSRT